MGQVRIFDTVQHLNFIWKGELRGSIELIKYKNFGGKGELYALSGFLMGDGQQLCKSREPFDAKIETVVSALSERGYAVLDTTELVDKNYGTLWDGEN